MWEVRQMLRWLFASIAVCITAASSYAILGSTAGQADPALPPITPVDALHQTLDDLRSFGYDVCEPVLLPLEPELEAAGVLGAAADGDPCVMWLAVGLQQKDVRWVVWHEACHLAVGARIGADPASANMHDPAHKHPLFLDCLDLGPAERGGY